VSEHSVKLTPTRRAVLAKLGAGGLYLYGPEVRVARALETAGLVRVEDNGEMATVGGRVDGERWCGYLTSVGEEFVRKMQPPTAVICWRCEHEWDANVRAADAKCQACGADGDGHDGHVIRMEEAP
jgi:hypothetical protein